MVSTLVRERSITACACNVIRANFLASSYYLVVGKDPASPSARATTRERMRNLMLPRSFELVRPQLHLLRSTVSAGRISFSARISLSLSRSLSSSSLIDPAWPHLRFFRGREKSVSARAEVTPTADRSFRRVVRRERERETWNASTRGGLRVPGILAGWPAVRYGSETGGRRDERERAKRLISTLPASLISYIRSPYGIVSLTVAWRVSSWTRRDNRRAPRDGYLLAFRPSIRPSVRRARC